MSMPAVVILGVTISSPSYCKTIVVRVPFILQHWRRKYIFYQQSISSASENTKIKGSTVFPC